VARFISPRAFAYDRSDVAPYIRQMSDGQRVEARASAYVVIGMVRGHDASKEGA